MENPNADTFNSKGSLAFPMENPFSLKVGQIFTGFGIGCGIGVGVGRPIYLGAIPALQQVISATRGATDTFSGVGRHVNNSLRKLGIKNIEAGVGCGVGIGHGFGVGIALKPGVVQRIQSSVAEVVTNIMMKIGIKPGLSSVKSVIPGSVQSSVNVLDDTSGRDMQSMTGNVLDLTYKTTGSTFQLSRSDESSNKEPTHNSYQSEGNPSDIAPGSRTEKVINSFLQNPVLKNEHVELHELAEKLHSENNALQVLLKHQQIIEKLMEDNRKFHQIFMEDLKVPPSKLQASNENWTKHNCPCSECFECRRRKRKSAR